VRSTGWGQGQAEECAELAGSKQRPYARALGVLHGGKLQVMARSAGDKGRCVRG